ncbi:hypothetical protein BKA81DRAFT_132897 [Phyllosticta paracitricarpa]
MVLSNVITPSLHFFTSPRIIPQQTRKQKTKRHAEYGASGTTRRSQQLVPWTRYVQQIRVIIVVDRRKQRLEERGRLLSRPSTVLDRCRVRQHVRPHEEQSFVVACDRHMGSSRSSQSWLVTDAWGAVVRRDLVTAGLEQRMWVAAAKGIHAASPPHVVRLLRSLTLVVRDWGKKEMPQVYS